MSKSLQNLMAEVEEMIGKKALTKLLEDTLKMQEELKAREKLDTNLILAKAADEGKDRLLIKTSHVNCDHGVVFDEEEYKSIPNMTSEQVKAKWPRGFGICPKGCGFEGIAYASFLHYIAGDW